MVKEGKIYFVSKPTQNLISNETQYIHELGEVQISLHKFVHIDWLRFCALRNKMDNERKGNAGGGQRVSQAIREETAR